MRCLAPHSRSGLRALHGIAERITNKGDVLVRALDDGEGDVGNAAY